LSEPGDIPTISSIVDEAVALAGAEKGSALRFTETLELLVESCRATGRLNPGGRRVLHKSVLRHLRNQLYLDAYISQASGPGSPAAVSGANEPGRAPPVPVVVTGLPRTGTTLLHNLLAVDPANRVLRFWEALHPIPPDPAAGASREVLVAKAEKWLERLYEMTPAFRSIHALTAEGPEECDALLQNTFASQHFDDMFDAQDYSAWLNSADLSDHYAYYRLQLQTLAGADDGARPWVLKSPSHLAHLGALLANLPEAVVVHCHRDPVEAVPSYASLVMAVRSPNSDEVSPAVVGDQCLRRCLSAMGRALEVRAARHGHGFFDVSYPELVSDPRRVVAALYRHLGRPLERQVESAIGRWVADHPQHRHGRHRYDLDDFGLSAGVIAESFSDYLDRFGPIVHGS